MSSHALLAIGLPGGPYKWGVPPPKTGHPPPRKKMLAHETCINTKHLLCDGFRAK